MGLNNCIKYYEELREDHGFAYSHPPVWRTGGGYAGISLEVKGKRYIGVPFSGTDFYLGPDCQENPKDYAKEYTKESLWARLVQIGVYKAEQRLL